MLPTDASGLPAVNLEIAPSFGYDEDSFAEAWAGLPNKPLLVEGLVLA